MNTDGHREKNTSGGRRSFGWVDNIAYTLHRAPVGQGLLPPRPARAFESWSLRALAKERRGQMYVWFITIIMVNIS